MKVQNVLFATDFSRSADAAQDAGMEIASQFDAQFHVFHALELPLPIFEPYGVGVPDSFLAESRESARKNLDRVLDEVRARGLTGENSLGEVPAAIAIADYAEKVSADLVVVGTEGHMGIKHILIGSVAEGVVRSAPCSVVVSRGTLAAATGPVVVGIDFSDCAREALEGACEIADQLGADLHMVHAANTVPLLSGPYGVPAPTDFYNSILQDARTRLAELAAGCAIKGNVTTEVSTAPAQHALSEVARQRDARLVVVGSRGLTGIKHLVLGSVAERTVRHAPCSVWVVRRTH